MPEIKLIIFDWDDVFTTGSKQGYFACYHETLAELGITLHPDEEKKRILAKWGQPHREELKALLIEHPPSLNLHAEYMKKNSLGIPLPIVLPLLQALGNSLTG